MLYKTKQTQCCIAGGGPAGMMLGLLLARAGLKVLVLEKHADFLRDFRGDTIHPSTMDILKDIGLLNKFLKLPHQKTGSINIEVGDKKIKFSDFSKLKTETPYIAFIPQWDFLSFLEEEAKKYENFELEMNTEVIDILTEDGKVVGIKAKTKNGELQVNADLIVGADGRGSIVRKKADLNVQEYGAPIDILWFRISREKSDPVESLGRFQKQAIMIMLNREEYWQCGYVIPKGDLKKVKAAGLPALLKSIEKLAPFLNKRDDKIKTWNDVKLLTVKVDRLKKWYRNGLVCIGDSAHAMSPVGGVGINLAIQDAVAAANIIGPAFSKGEVTIDDLRKIQERRELPTKVIQKMQLFLQERFLSKVISGKGEAKLPLVVQIMLKVPFLRSLPPRIIAFGVRPERVDF
jgi:2-polyprenyl-6-methoxyphenol hydroxylase-like FAD-dependent oxidoreductase